MENDGIMLTMEQANLMTQAVECWKSVVGQHANLDNRTDSAGSMPIEGDSEMARLKVKTELPDGTKAWFTGDNMETVIENVIRRVMDQQQNPNPVQSMKLKDFVENVYKPTYFKGLAATTINTQSQYLDYNIYPFMGEMQLTEITVKTIQDFYNWMAEGEKFGRKKNLTQNTINNVTKVLNKIFRVAIELHYIADNPIKRTLLKNPGEKAVHFEAISVEKAQKAREKIPALENERQRLFMALLAYDTGMRPEEILGLRWEDINLEKGYLEIKRTVTYPDKNKPCVKDGGKTELSARTVILNPALKAMLETATSRNGYVIHGKTTDDPVCMATYRRTHKNAFETLGIGEYTPYNWRSTFATELCEMGLYSSKQVADMMGHSTTRMVENVYATKRRDGILANRGMIDRKSEHYFSAN